MNNQEIIKTRKSIRTFNNKKISKEDKEKLVQYMQTIKNPYDIPIEFIILDQDKYNLSSPVIEGEDFYIAAKIPKTEHCEEAYGYSFEKLILYAWSLGIGTTWIGGTFNRELFEKAANTNDDEYMMIATPVGYPSNTRTQVDKDLRNTIKGDTRLPVQELFYENNLQTPLETKEDWMEAVRWAPSAANRQPWRIICNENKYHFYLEHTKGYTSTVEWDVQKIDMGIAICHFMTIHGGQLSHENPGIQTSENIEYIATIK